MERSDARSCVLKTAESSVRCELKAMLCCLFLARKLAMTSLGSGRGTQGVLLPNFELPASAISVACLAPQIALVLHEEMTCVGDLSKQFLKGRQGRDLSRFQQRLFAFGSDVTLHQSQPLRHTDTRAFRSFGFLLQVHVRQQTFRCLLGHDIRQRNFVLLDR